MRRRIACVVTAAASIVFALVPSARAEIYNWPIEYTIILPDTVNLGTTCQYNASGLAEVRRVNSQRDIYEYGSVTWRSSCANQTIGAQVRIYDTTAGPVHLDIKKSSGSRVSGSGRASASHSQTVNYRDASGELKPLYHARTIYIQYPLFVRGEERDCVEVQWDVIEGDPTLSEPTFHFGCHVFPVVA
ncbi:MAG: hypothetical protein M3279_04590 [Actinomycetota bacterium]|nr:hypothetical protein [Actinomycetota bacterium]